MGPVLDDPVLEVGRLGVGNGLKVHLADQGGGIAGGGEHGGDTGRVVRQGYAVGDGPMGAGVLPGEHRGPGRSADDVGAVGPLETHT